MKKILTGFVLGALGLLAVEGVGNAAAHDAAQHIVMPPSAVVAAAAKEDAATTDKTAFDLTSYLFKARAQNSNMVFSPYCFQQIIPLIRENTYQETTKKELLPYMVPGIRAERLANTKTGELILLNKKLAKDYTGYKVDALKLVDYPYEALEAKEDFQRDILGSVIDGQAPQGDLNFLTAAHYFAEWETKFNKKLTAERPFTNELGKTKNVTTMKGHFTDAHGATTADYNLVTLYAKNHAMVYFIQPRKDINAVAANLGKIVQDYEGHKVAHFSNIDLEVPKISIKNKLDLKDLLKNEMKISSFFTGLTFDKLTGKVPYVLATASQTATLDLNEDYAEGKAITEIGFRATAAMIPEEVHNIKIDSPYFIVIKDWSNIGLRRTVFTAFIADPNKQ
jgi:serine protease inhibitor